MSSGPKASAAVKRPPARKITGNAARRAPAATRLVLFPTEPSTIGRKKIEAAVRAVITRRSS